jgi:hypothetical protein
MQSSTGPSLNAKLYDRDLISNGSILVAISEKWPAKTKKFDVNISTNN